MSYQGLNRIKGSGRLYFDGMELAKVQNISMSFDEETIEAYAGDSLEPWAIDVVGKKLTGSFQVGAMSPQAFGKIMGTTAEASGIVVVDGEGITLATSVTLDNTPVVADMCTVWVDSENKKLFTEVAVGSEVAGTFSCDDDTGELVFHTDDSGDTGYASYGYRTQSTDYRAYIDKDTTADYMTLIFTADAGNQPSQTSNDNVTFHLPKVKVHGWTWDIGLKEYSFASFNFTAIPGDTGRSLEIYMPTD